MAKITRAGGPSNEAAGLTRTAFGGHVEAGFTERDGGFVDTTAETLATHAEREEAVTEPEVTVEAPWNPGDYSVADVMSERANCSDVEWEAVLALERAGKNRSGIR